jgi:hypothetical protein
MSYLSLLICLEALETENAQPLVVNISLNLQLQSCFHYALSRICTQLGQYTKLALGVGAKVGCFDLKQ